MVKFVDMQNIDIDSSLSEQSVVDTILQEVLQGTPQTEVAYIQEDTGVQRYTLHQSLQQIQELDSSALSKSDILLFPVVLVVSQQSVLLN